MCKTKLIHVELSGQVRQVLTNILVGSAFAAFAYSCGTQLLSGWRLSIALIVAKESLDAFFFMCRRLPKEVTAEKFSWLMAIGGTVAPLLVRPAGEVDGIVGTCIQNAGLCLQILSICSLNRSFGIVPANRGVRRKGMYSFVRHPLYVSYAISLSGFIINNFSLYNAIVCTVAVAFNLRRVTREEEFLLKDERYQEYAKETPWKMIPYLY